ncbi:sugar phosphate nucleotidyltransferase [Halomarina oriensis]|uniref:NTP transferase domain-containing protein n=1 Tax=Halomarina oriensis TaxID=671145 RepID=A0A6B0GKE6_9EURY|nr:NDP-sugar synthase [Halomarina oriensis]MWG35224.1 NTP transferase domain-containing protein [Halomarina oriensis]
MHAVVLAGGYATRLWPITRHRPKMLLPVGDSTVIDRILSDLETDDRIEHVYLSTNERFAPAFEEHLADKGYEKASLSIEDTLGENEKFGVVGALAQLVDREGVDDDLLVVAGDNLMGFSMSDFLDFSEEKSAPSIAAYDVGSREKAKSYGLVALEGDRVVDFQEKPEEPKSTLVSIACYAFPADSVRFEEYLSGDNNPDEPGWYVQWLQSEEDVFAYSFEEPWYDIGTPDAYLEAVQWALDGESIVAADATVEDCEVGENVHVMPGADLSGVSLTNSVVFHDAVVEDSNLVDSIVDEHAEVTGKTLTHSLVGSYSRLC